MTVYHWTAIGLAALYGGASALAGVRQFKQAKIPRWSALGMSLAGLWVLLSGALASNPIRALAVHPAGANKTAWGRI